MKGMLKLGLVLALFATAACVGLALVYTGTAKIIEERQQADLDAALRELFPSGEVGFTDITGKIESPDPQVTFEAQYAVMRGSEPAGVVIRASRGSYNGAITVLTGIGIDGKISGIKILSHQDTPGLGANAASPTYYVDKASKLTFYGQFAGKSLRDPFEVKNDVEAITASTITSRAVALTVKASAMAAGTWFNNGAAEYADGSSGASPMPGGAE